MTALPDMAADFVDNVDAVFLFSPSGSDYERANSLATADVDDEEAEVEPPTVVVIAPTNTVNAAQFVELPLEFENVRNRIVYGIEGALEQELLEDSDEVACFASVFGNDVDTVTHLRVDADDHSGVYDLFVNSRAEAGVIRDVLEVAIDLGKKGQKGKPVGALFVVGDAGKVMNKSRPLSYNPFEKSHVHVGDPIVNVMLKEFSRLDGAFVISDSGKIVSAYRYLEPSAEGVDIPKGLGARHMAAGAISRDTNATAVALSESDGLVRAFKGGELVLEIDPEDY
jgi:DNA integrity scanning protein DisA with diadenylate cyclase activity